MVGNFKRNWPVAVKSPFQEKAPRKVSRLAGRSAVLLYVARHSYFGKQTLSLSEQISSYVREPGIIRTEQQLGFLPERTFPPLSR